ncbi:MAG: T9SS type A sorting domain-containing protein [Bacteroidales bacterium]|nr:T9SS type A sorting domain-containing protein [Bacteroidales bacterium]
MKKLTFFLMSIIFCSMIYAANYDYPVWKINCGFRGANAQDPDQTNGAIQGFVPDTFAVKGDALWYWGLSDNTMSTAGVTNAAPSRVYQYCRFAWSGDTEYQITGLVPGQNYRVRLHWAEEHAQNAEGKRLMDIKIQNQYQDVDFDIFKEAGDLTNKAVVRDYDDIAADANGKIDILFVQKTQLAVIYAIEIYSAVPPVVPTSYKYPVWKINCGFRGANAQDPDQTNGAIQGFVPDTFAIKGDALWYWGVSDNQMSTNGVTNAAPSRVYQYCRFAWSGDTEYKITGLVSGRNYMVRLHWAEAVGTLLGQRLMDVKMQGQYQDVDFDIYKEAGNHDNLAVVRDYPDIAADANGNIDITFVPKVNLATIYAIEIYSDVATNVSPITINNRVKVIKMQNNQIKIESFNGKIADVDIFNINGQTVYSKSGINNNQMNIDVNKFLKGVYVVKVNVKGETISQKIIL